MKNDTLQMLPLARAGDEQAMEELITQNSGLVYSIVRRFSGRGVPQDDLYQLGVIGLIKAVRGYDPAYGTAFSTYAVPKITGEIRRFLRDDGAVKISRPLKARAAAAAAATERLTAELDRPPTVSELARELSLPEEEIAILEGVATPCVSLNRENGEEGYSLLELIEGGSNEKTIEYIALREAIASLPPAEAQVIELRYFHDLTQERCARILGINQVQVSRLEKKAVLHLGEELK